MSTPEPDGEAAVVVTDDNLPANERHYEPGQRLRITFEAELLRVEQASANRGVARLILRAGAGMNDSVWLVREPDFGQVISVEALHDGG